MLMRCLFLALVSSCGALRAVPATSRRAVIMGGLTGVATLACGQPAVASLTSDLRDGEAALGEQRSTTRTRAQYSDHAYPRPDRRCLWA